MEESIFDHLENREPEEIIRLVASVRSGAIIPDSDVNWLGTAEGLADRMRAEPDTERMRGLGRSTISVYDFLAESQRDTCHSYELSAMMARAFLINTLGIKSGDDLQDPAILVDWFLSRTSYLPDEARIESEKFWPRTREHGFQPADVQQITDIRRIRNRLRIFNYLKDQGVELGDSRIDEWLDVFDSLL